MATETQREYADRMFGRQGYRWCYNGEHCGWQHPLCPTHEVPAHEPTLEFARRMLGLDRPTSEG